MRPCQPEKEPIRFTVPTSPQEEPEEALEKTQDSYKIELILKGKDLAESEFDYTGLFSLLP